MCRKFFSRQRKRRPLDSDPWRWWRGDREKSQPTTKERMKKMCKTTITVPPLRILCSLHRVQSPLIIHTRCVKERQTELTVLKKARSDNRKESELNIWMFLLPFLCRRKLCSFWVHSDLLLSNNKWFMCVTRFQDFIVELCWTFVFQGSVIHFH